MPRNSEDHANAVPIAASAARPDGGVPPFARGAWFDLLAAHCVDLAAVDMAHAAVGRAEAWLPLLRESPAALRAMANWYSFSFGPLIAPPGSPDGAAALAALAADLKRSNTRISLAPVSDRDGSRAALTQAFQAAGWYVEAQPTGHNHWLDVGPGGFAAYWEGRPGALRNTVKRKAKAGVVALTLTDRFDSNIWAAYEHIYTHSWKPAEGHPAFLRAFAEAEGAGGRLRLGLARIGDRPVAAQFWTVEGGTAFIHKLAHVEDSDKASPGTLLTHALFAHVIDKDAVKRIDFGTGDDAYKRDWMNRHDPLWTLEMHNPKRAASWPAITRAALRRRLHPNKDQ